MHVLPDPFAKKIDSWSDDTVSSYRDSQIAPDASTQDSIETTQLNLSALSLGGTPRIPIAPPSVKAMSDYELNLFIMKALSDYKQLRASIEDADTEQRLQAANFIAEQVKVYQGLQQKRLEALNNLEKLVEENLEDLKQKQVEVQVAASRANAAINRLNSGSEEDRLANQEKANAAIEVYNQCASDYNAGVNGLISNAQLADYLTENAIVIPTANQAPSIAIEEEGKAVSIAVIPLVPMFNFFSLVSELRDHHAYALYVAPIDEQLRALEVYFPILKKCIDHGNKTIEASALHTDIAGYSQLIQDLLYSHLSSSSNSLATSALLLQAMGLTDSHVRTLIGEKLVKEMMLSNEKQNKTLSIEREIGEQKAAELVFFNLGLLQAEVVQAIAPSLAFLAKANIHEEKVGVSDIVVLLTVSLANRFLENNANGVNATALNAYIEADGVLKSLTLTERKTLFLALQFGQTMAIGKALESVLGLPGLLIHTLSFDNDQQRMQTFEIGRESESQDDRVQQEKSKEKYKEQGFSEEEALFLSHVSLELTKAGLLTPQLSCSISSRTLNFPLLQNTLTVALVMDNHSLDDAKVISQNALKTIFSSTAFSSQNQFYEELQTNLKDLGVDRYAEIAHSARLLPPCPPLLDRLSFSAPMTEQMLSEVIDQRVMEVFAPKWGASLGQQLSQEIAVTLFGADPLKRDRVQPASLSLVKEMQRQVENLKAIDGGIYTAHIHEAFKESVKTLESSSAFTLKLLDPAYRFIRLSGLIYDTKDAKRPLDVSI